MEDFPFTVLDDHAIACWSRIPFGGSIAVKFKTVYGQIFPMSVVGLASCNYKSPFRGRIDIESPGVEDVSFIMWDF